MKYYIAYGSNLSVDQMAYRCPDARVAGKAVLKGWKLVFRFHATIEPDEGGEVPVLIWEIDGRDEQRLDRYEGFPRYYIKKDLPVAMTELKGMRQRRITAMVYLMAPGRTVTPPADDYYGVIAEGYERFGFDPDPLETALAESRKSV